MAIIISLSMPGGPNAVAQEAADGSTSRLFDVDAAPAARAELEEALSSDDGNRRFPALRVARSIDEPWIADFVLPLCKSPNFMERILALEAVMTSDPARGRAEFIEALSSGERALRLRGLLGLAAIGDPGAVPQLVHIMEEDPDPDLQTAAAQALGEVGGAQAVEALYDAITSGYPPLREQAVLALIAVRDPNLEDHLIEALDADHPPGREEILRLLSLLRDPALVDSIKPYLEDDNDLIRTLAAAAILSNLKGSGKPQP